MEIPGYNDPSRDTCLRDEAVRRVRVFLAGLMAALVFLADAFATHKNPDVSSS